MARLRAAELHVGDRLRYTVGKGPAATQMHIIIEGIEHADGAPPMALCTREDTGEQIIMRLGHLARYSTRLRKLAS